MATISVNVLYFAQMADQRGLAEETIETQATTASDLFDTLSQAHTFTTTKEVLRVAINDQYAPWETALNNNDTVVFISPVAGG